jgi:hypothetical protein
VQLPPRDSASKRSVARATVERVLKSIEVGAAGGGVDNDLAVQPSLLDP